MAVVNVTPPVVSGSARVGQTLTTTNGTWTHSLDYLTYAYQWLRCDALGANCVDISGADTYAYQIQQADVGSTLRSEVTATDTAFPPDPDEKLTWAPPTAGSGGVAIVTFDLNNATRSSGTLGSGAGRDLVINQTEILTGVPTQITGWRHIIWIGGEINVTSGSDLTGIAVRNITGTVHLEGVYIHGSAIADCFVMRSAESSQGMTVQIENCYFQNNDIGGEHADNTQFQQAKVNAFRIDKCTFYSELQGTFMRVGGSAVDYAKNVDFRRLNFRGPGNNMFWQNWEGSSSTPTLKKIIPVTLDDVWIDMTGSSRPNVARRVVPDSLFFDGFSSGSRRGAFLDSDVTSDFVYWSDGSQVVPVGASAGQMSLDCGITGFIRAGIPPGGDFCPTSTPGIAYVSPGYL